MYIIITAAGTHTASELTETIEEAFNAGHAEVIQVNDAHPRRLTMADGWEPVPGWPA